MARKRTPRARSPRKRAGCDLLGLAGLLNQKPLDEALRDVRTALKSGGCSLAVWIRDSSGSLACDEERRDLGDAGALLVEPRPRTSPDYRPWVPHRRTDVTAGCAISSGDGALGLVAMSGPRGWADGYALFCQCVALAVSSARAQRAAQRHVIAFHNMALASTETEGDRLRAEILRIICSATGSDRAALYLLDETGEWLVLAATHGYAGPLRQKYARIPSVGTASGESASAIAPRALSRADCPEEDWPDLDAGGFRELALIPLHVSGKTAGSLILGRLQSLPYAPDELRRATALGEQIAVLLDKQRLVSETQSRVRQLSLLFELAQAANGARQVEPLVKTLLEHSVAAVGADSAIIYLREGNEVLLKGFYARPELQGYDERQARFQRIPLDSTTLTGQAILTGQTVVDRGSRSRAVEESGAFEVAATPLRVKEQTFGAFVTVRMSPAPFSPGDLELIEAVGSLFAVALERTLSSDTELRRVHALAEINELSAQIATRIDERSALQTSAQHLARICDVPNVLIYLLEPGLDTLRLAAFSRRELDAFGARMLRLADTSVVVTATRTRQPVVVQDARNDPRSAIALARQMGHVAVLGVPLLSEGEPIGSILLGETREGRTFGRDQIERAVAVSHRLASAITQARLYDDLKHSYEKLTRTQQALVVRERLAAVGELAALVAHEVRNPLAVIFNSVASLRRILQPTSDAELLLSIVTEEAERLNQLVSDFLDFARPNEPLLRQAQVAPVIEQAIESATRSHATPRVTVEPDFVEPDLEASFDARLLRQAVLNLVVNALQALPRGGLVRVKLSSERRGSVPHARIDVQDNGSGVAPAIQSRLFQPFFTTKASGTGLGLAVVRRIMEGHRGEAWCTSTEQGSIFSLAFPLSPPTEPKTPALGVRLGEADDSSSTTIGGAK